MPARLPELLHPRLQIFKGEAPPVLQMVRGGGLKGAPPPRALWRPDEELDELSDDDSAVETFVAIAPLPGLGVIDSGAPCVSKPLVDGSLPSTVYLLVDREVELKGTPVKNFSELGAVADTEMEQQAIALFSNPRQAKRQCGRSQRVIKVPDSGVFGRTAPFILAQGISRIVLEGSLYAIPGA